MATYLFRVKVKEKKNDSLTFGLRIISAEQPGFYGGKSFALMLLYDPIVGERVKDAPLGRSVTFENTLDPAWVTAHVDDYIRSCRLFDVVNTPPTENLAALSPKERKSFWKSDRAPQASLEVTVTDPQWIEHLKKGDEWDSAAYDLMF